MLVSRCFDANTLNEVNIEEIFLHKESQSYYVIFSIERVLTLEEEYAINTRKENVFYGMPKVKFFYDYSSLYDKNYMIIEYINNILLFEYSAFRPFLEESHSYIDAGRYHIDFKNELGKEMFSTMKLGPRIEEILSFNFKKNYTLAVGVDKSLKGLDVSNITIFEPIAANKKSRKEEKKVNPKPKKKTKPKISQAGKAIYGSTIRRKPIDICDISDETNRVIIEGQVVDTDHKTCRNGSKLILFSVTDYTSTILCKIFWAKINSENFTVNLKTAK